MSRSILLGVLGGCAVIVGAVIGARDHPTAVDPTRGSTESTTSTIDVHVAGWVGSPGVVRVPEGSIVADAIAAAGGFKPGANSDSINLAASLARGDQILVPGPDAAVSASAEDGLVALNTATPSELETLPGVGPVLAQRIVAHREARGPFRVVEDLLDVPGIGESKLGSIRDLVKVP